jgi:hypothetical protein
VLSFEINAHRPPASCQERCSCLRAALSIGIMAG